MNISILSPSNNLYSETFIHAHRNIEGNIYFFHDGEIPKKVEGLKFNNLINLGLRIYFRVFSFFLGGAYRYDKFKLKRNLKRCNINVGLAEYGTTAACCFDVFKRLNIPLVVHFHGYDASSQWVKEKYYDSYKLMFDYVSSIIAVSKEMRTDLINLGADPAKVFLNPYGPAEIFSMATNNPSNPITFLHVGRFTAKKSPENTIKAFAACLKSRPNIRLQMIGDGVLVDKCKLLVRTLNIESKVAFLGRKGPNQVVKYMEAAFAFVLHSMNSSSGDKEGTPVSILEAMAVGLPVISTRHSGIKDVVVENETGYLVEEQDIKGMTRYMMFLLENPDKAKSLGNNGRKRVLSHFTLDKHLNRIEQLLYNAVLN